MNRARCPAATDAAVSKSTDAARVPPRGAGNPASSRLNRAWRVFASGACFVLFGAVTLFASLVLLLFIKPMPILSRASKRRATLRTMQWLSRVFIDLMQIVGLMRYSVEREDRLAAGGHLIVANHPSLIDALFIIGRAPGVCCIVKRELLDNPFIAPLVRLAGYLVNDSDTLIDDAAEVLRSGRNLLVFPEGTRNRDDVTLAFHRGAAHIAIASRARVVPVTIDFSPRSLQKGDEWYAVPPRSSTIRLRVHAPLDLLAETQPSLPVRPGDAGPYPLPVTLLARRVTARLRDFYVDQTRRFADPQGRLP